jgi:hypothetical protein
METTTRMRRRALGAAAAILVCGAIAAPAVALAAPSAPQATPQCTASQTYVWFGDAPNGAAGTIYYPVEFTNLGRHACYLYGYPGVSGLTSSGRRIGPAAGRVGAPRHRVTIGHNQTAHALLGIVEAGIIAGCHPATGAGLGVYPPNQRAEQQIGNFTFPACKSKVYLHVYPVQAGIGVP